MGMVGGVEILLGSLEPEHLLPKYFFESWISVRDNRMRHAMKLEDMIHENLIHNGDGERVLKRTEMIIFGKMIYYHHDD